jgi:serine/threonine-protein kinase
LSLLAKGGMGEVYLGRMRGPAGFQKLVVIKRNLPSADEEARSQMLFAEARLVATLQHANIVQVYDVGHDSGVVFVAMEYLHGQDLRAVIKRTWGAGKPLSRDYAIAAALAVCSGLQYAHDKRDADGVVLEIVHRDVSPSNVFVTYDGTIKLIDFGIAKATSLPSETKLGTIKGKPGYMSPEQALGDPIDRRSDIFCVGILLYELTTGRSPFRHDTEYKTMQAILERDPPRPTELDAAYPPALEAIVMRALAKDRRHRYSTAAALQDDLAAFARAQRLDISPYEVGRVMAAQFGTELAAWRQAQSAGQSLEDFVVQRTTGAVPALLDEVPAGDNKATIAEKPVRARRRPSMSIMFTALALVGAAVGFGLMRVDAKDNRPSSANVGSAAAIPTAPPIAGEPAATSPPESPPTKPPEAPTTAPPEPRASGQESPSEIATPAPPKKPTRRVKLRAAKPPAATSPHKPTTSPSAPTTPIDPDGVW